MKPLTWTELDNRIPPPMARLLAREGRGTGSKPLTCLDISRRSGLSVQRVAWISRQKDYSKVTGDQRDRYLRGCGITPQNTRRHIAYWKDTASLSWPLAHLSKLSPIQRSQLATL